MSPRPFEVPAPRPDDGENVAWALITSASLFKGGDLGESLRWLRRAASSSAETGNDSRAVDLYRAAAELSERVPKEAGSLDQRIMPIPPLQPVVIQTADAIAPTVPGEVMARRRAALAAVSGTNSLTLQDVRMEEQTLMPFTQKAPERVVDEAQGPDTARASLEALSAIPASTRRPAEAPPPEPPPRKSLSSDEATMTSLSSFRVAVLEGEDGAPRIVRLATDADAPEGAARAVLVATAAGDARRIAVLLGANKR